MKSNCNGCFNCIHWNNVAKWYWRLNIFVQKPKYGVCNANTKRKSTMKYNCVLRTHCNHYCSMHEIKTDVNRN